MKFSFYLTLSCIFLNTSLVFAKENLNNIYYSDIAKKRPIELYDNNQKQNPNYDFAEKLFKVGKALLFGISQPLIEIVYGIRKDRIILNKTVSSTYSR